MKKFFALGFLTLALVTVSHQQAHAWSNVKFGAGVNLQWQAGDNTLLWGFFRNGQVPHPYGHGVPPHLASPYHHHGVPAPAPVPPGAGLQVDPQTSPANYQQYQNTNGYQPVSYNPYYSQYPGYSSYQIPSYWYGR